MNFLERLIKGLHIWDRENQTVFNVLPWENLSSERKLTYQCQAERVRDVLKGMKEENGKAGI